MSLTRLVTLEDVPVLVDLLRANREFFAPYEPHRDEHHFTDEGQRAVVERVLREYEQGVTVPHLILDDGRVVGRITLHHVVRGPLQSCVVGYWVNADDNGRGLATAAVGAMVCTAFQVLRLHRVEAGTLVHNVRSQRVLERNGFVRYGLAPAYLRNRRRVGRPRPLPNPQPKPHRVRLTREAVV